MPSRTYRAAIVRPFKSRYWRFPPRNRWNLYEDLGLVREASIPNDERGRRTGQLQKNRSIMPVLCGRFTSRFRRLLRCYGRFHGWDDGSNSECWPRVEHKHKAAVIRAKLAELRTRPECTQSDVEQLGRRSEGLTFEGLLLHDEASPHPSGDVVADGAHVVELPGGFCGEGDRPALPGLEARSVHLGERVVIIESAHVGPPQGLHLKYGNVLVRDDGEVVRLREGTPGLAVVCILEGDRDGLTLAHPDRGARRGDVLTLDPEASLRGIAGGNPATSTNSSPAESVSVVA